MNASRQQADLVALGLPKQVWLFMPYLVYRVVRLFMPKKHPWSKRSGNPAFTYQHWCDTSTQLNLMLGIGQTITLPTAIILGLSLLFR